jgi:hypothetical protein
MEDLSDVLHIANELLKSACFVALLQAAIHQADSQSRWRLQQSAFIKRLWSALWPWQHQHYCRESLAGKQVSMHKVLFKSTGRAASVMCHDDELCSNN